MLCSTSRAVCKALLGQRCPHCSELLADMMLLIPGSAGGLPIGTGRGAAGASERHSEPQQRGSPDSQELSGQRQDPAQQPLHGEKIERDNRYISSSHLGLIRCLPPLGVSVMRHAQKLRVILGDPMEICLPNEVNHGLSMLSKHPGYLS